MISRRLPKTLIIVCAFLATAFLAYILGVTASGWIGNDRLDDYILSRNLQSRQILNQMGTVQIGDTLPDFTFVTLDRKTVRLSELVARRTVLSLFDPTCESCVFEIRDLHSAVAAGTDRSFFLFVSKTNPLDLVYFRDELGMTSPILYDDNAIYSSYVGALGLPLNLIIDKNLVIEDVITGALTAREYAEIVADNHRY